MGINRQDLELLIQLREQKHIPLNPYVAEIGAQQLSNSFLRSEDLVRKAEGLLGTVQPFVMPAPSPTISSAERTELLAGNAPFARDFWVALGFEYTAIDVDGSPGSIPLDLNYDQVSPALQSKYGLVTNLGTTEHVCNQMNAFKAIHDLAALGGVMIHHLPAGGMLNHGLVNYTPKFFWHLARSNEYRWLYMSFYGSDHRYTTPANLVDFTRSYDPVSSETMSRREISDYAIMVAFQKTLDIPFVAPLDVNTGTKTKNDILNRRYWTVFQPSILESVRQGGKLPEWTSHSSTDKLQNACEEIISLEAKCAVPQIEDTALCAPVRIQNRRYIAFVAAVSALCGAIVMAFLLLVARLLLP